MELIKDYDLNIQYHSGKANVVADTLSRKASCDCILLERNLDSLCRDMRKMNISHVPEGFLSMLQVTSHLLRDIKEGKHLDENLARIKERLEDPKYKSFHLDQYKTLWFGKRLVVSNQEKLKRQILNEAHESLFSIHPGSNKMYRDVRKRFLWKGLKQDIARFVAECDVCCRVKAEHLKPAGTLQPLPILAWKWEDITMDFITGLPRTSSGHDSIWVIVYRLTKSAHFIQVKINYAVSKYAELYLTKIVCLHGILKTIMSDRGPQFTSQLWEELHKAMETTLLFSTAYHPQTVGQTERVNQIIEDMLRACAIIYSGSWDTCLPFAEFAYNNSHQMSINMSPYEALYGRDYRTPLNWSEVGERHLYGARHVNEAKEKVDQICIALRAAQERYKAYTDNHRRKVEYKVGEYMYLKVTPFKGTRRFQEKGKLAPRYVGPYRIYAK